MPALHGKRRALRRLCGYSAAPEFSGARPLVRMQICFPALCFPALVALLALMSCTPTAASSPPVLRNTGGQFTFVTPVEPAPDVGIRALDGGRIDLRQFRGKVVVLNFWASWCAPCVYEMPSLARLAAKSDPHELSILAVSIDRNGAAAVRPFIAAHHLEGLPVYLDPRQRLGSVNTRNVDAGALPLWGLPITYIINRKGEVVGYIVGATDWDSPQAQRFLRHFLEQPTP